MACRFPNRKSISEYWQLLVNGVNAVTEGPPGSVIGRTGQRLPDSNARNDAVRFGAFVEDIELFDAEFFRISPLEAQLLDPQQRMMLETTWRALEDAALDPQSLRESRTGVYVGISNYDYRDMVAGYADSPADTGALWPMGPVREIAVPQRNGNSAKSPVALKERASRLLPLSGKTPEALRDLAQRYL